MHTSIFSSIARQIVSVGGDCMALAMAWADPVGDSTLLFFGVWLE
jgi:hypothetical protein